MSLFLQIQILILCSICIIISLVACCSLTSHYKSVPFTKKNILTKLDEFFVFCLTFFVCIQCAICAFSAITNMRNELIYLIIYVILYSSFTVIMAIAISLSCFRILILNFVRIYLRFVCLLIFQFQLFLFIMQNFSLFE